MQSIIEIAKILKERENKNIIGCIVGKIISQPPDIIISILNGSVLIKEVYILENLLEGFSKSLTIPITSAEGETNIIAHKHSTLDSDGIIGETDENEHKHNIVSISIKAANVIFEDTLKKGDDVLLISSQDNQTFFLIGKIKKIGSDS